MKATRKKRKSTDISPEEAMKQIQQIFKKRGSRALEMARREILKERIECKEAREALTYFMTEYWQDLARPALLSLVCEVVGGDPELTTPIAVPMILISGAIDIHDDIIDQSKTKHGRSTVYGKFGKDVALLVGDALLFKGLSLLNEAVEKGVPDLLMPKIVDTINDMFFELGDAEASELGFRGRIDLTAEDYLCIVRKKAADVEAHTRISAMLGGASNKKIEALGKYGRLLGMLIILRDDWIDTIDLQESRHRILKECLPLPILYTLQNANFKSVITPFLKKKKITKKDVQKVLEATYKAGSFRRMEKLMTELAEEASSKIRDVYKQNFLELLLKSTLLASEG